MMREGKTGLTRTKIWKEHYVVLTTHQVLLLCLCVICTRSSMPACTANSEPSTLHSRHARWGVHPTMPQIK